MYRHHPVLSAAKAGRAVRITASLAAGLGTGLFALLSASTAHAAASGLYAHAAYEYQDLPYGAQLVEGPGNFVVGLQNGNFTASADFGHAVATAGMQLFSYNTGMGTVMAAGGMQYDVTITVTGSGYTGEAVPYWVSGFSQLAASGNANSIASLQVVRSPFDQADVSLRSSFRGGSDTNSCGAEGGTDCGFGALSVTGTLLPYWSDAGWVGQTMQVKLLARTAVQANYVFGVGFSPSTGSALVDPLITVDPGYLAAHPNLNFSVNLNPAIPNAVPEPASVAMLLSGLGVLGVAARRRGRG